MQNSHTGHWLSSSNAVQEPLQEEDLICNPFSPELAGYLDWDGDEESTPRWKLLPAKDKPARCQDPPDWTELLKLADDADFQLDSDPALALRNKTILILGDSVDRNGLYRLELLFKSCTKRLTPSVTQLI